LGQGEGGKINEHRVKDSGVQEKEKIVISSTVALKKSIRKKVDKP
jgi:hypothetical protein